METTVLALALLVAAAALLPRIGGRGRRDVEDAPLVRLSPRGDPSARALPWASLRVVVVGGAIVLLVVIALPAIATTGLAGCTSTRGAAACGAGEPLGPLPWITLAAACVPLAVAAWADLQVVAERR